MMRTMTKVNTVGLVQAITAYRKQAVDKSLMEPGESLSNYASRLYAFGTWRVIMASGVTDKFVYDADSRLREETGEWEEDRAAMMHHYHLFEGRIHPLLVRTDEDYTSDMREKVCERNKRKMNALVNALTKEIAKAGVPHPGAMAVLSAYANFAYLTKDIYEASVKPLGEVIRKQLPTDARDALLRLERSAEAALRIMKRIDVGGKYGSVQTNERTKKFAYELFLNIVNPDELERAVKYANKEAKKEKRA